MDRTPTDATIIITILAGIFGGSPVAQAEDRVEITFPVAEVQEAAEQELLRYRKRPINYWCDPVDFATDYIFELAKRIESQGTSVEMSVVSIQIRSEKPVEFWGSYSWISDDQDVVEWAGKLADNEDHTVHFIIRAQGYADGLIKSEDGSFRLYTSLYKRNYLLCEYDPAYPDRKID